MQHTDALPIPTSVKLFPRLATANIHRKPKRASRRIAVQPVNAAVDTREAARTQVRARLLRMILENEQVRRNEQRPNAS